MLLYVVGLAAELSGRLCSSLLTIIPGIKRASKCEPSHVIASEQIEGHNLPLKIRRSFALLSGGPHGKCWEVLGGIASLVPLLSWQGGMVEAPMLSISYSLSNGIKFKMNLWYNRFTLIIIPLHLRSASQGSYSRRRCHFQFQIVYPGSSSHLPREPLLLARPHFNIHF